MLVVPHFEVQAVFLSHLVGYSPYYVGCDFCFGGRLLRCSLREAKHTVTCDELAHYFTKMRTASGSTPYFLRSLEEESCGNEVSERSFLELFCLFFCDVPCRPLFLGQPQARQGRWQKATVVFDYAFHCTFRRDDFRLCSYRGHSPPLTLPAVSCSSTQLGAVLDSIEVKKPRIPVVSNVDAKPHSDPAVIKEILKKQV